MAVTIEGSKSARDLRLAIAVSRFHDGVADRLVEGATMAIVEHGGDPARVVIVKVPGAFELPLIAEQLAKTGQYDGIVCLGAVVRGETYHFEVVANEAGRGIREAMQRTGIPMGLGVLTTADVQQALERSASGPSNKGYEATCAVLEMVDVLRRIHHGRTRALGQ